ncbi:MAG: LPS export ABC transporter periplasmic protein LptC [Hydrogenophilales bacterium]
MIFFKKTTLFLIIVILSTIVFYSYYISQNKGSINIDNTKSDSSNISDTTKGLTKFKNVEYKTTSKNNKEYTTKGGEALINYNKPDLIVLNKVHSFAKLNDGSILNIKSDNANYFKNTKNIKYFNNVIITNKDVRITAKVANFFADKNLIRLEKNVIFKDTKNTIKGDIAELNTITNNLEVSMNKKEDRIYGKRQNK